MNYECVPSCDLNPTIFCSRPKSFNSFATHAPSLEHEVAELTWEKGQVAMYGVAPPRVLNTLESIVDQATITKPAADNLVPWLDNLRAANTNMDALVPCNNSTVDNHDNSTHVPPGLGACTVGSCKSYASASQSQQYTLDSYENTSSGEDYTKTSGDDHEIVYHCRSKRRQVAAGDRGGGNRKLGIKKSSINLAKSRAAANHNQSERRRRDKINERMKTLQKLVPNSSKTDKASMLDEVIDYLKQLQAQVMSTRMMNMSMPISMNMNMNMLMQQHLHMSMMAAMGNMGMGMPMPMLMPMPMPMPMPTPDLLSNFFACQSQQAMTMDNYSRLDAALYQQYQQPSASASKTNSYGKE